VTPDRSLAIAFVIPVRNDAVRLRRCLDSIVRNDYPRASIEVLIVDNDSTDGSGEVARTYADTVIRLAGRSVAALRNRGARETRAPVVAFVDADHEIDREWIAAAVSTLSEPGVGAAGFPYDTQPDANWVQRFYDTLRHRPASRQAVAWLGSGNLAVKREYFDAIGGFRENLIACEDVDLCNRLIGAGTSIIADPRMRSTHYGDPNSLRSLFLGELWRGRDNLRVTFSGPRTLGHLRSALIPLAGLISVAAGLVALVSGSPVIAIVLWIVPVLATLARAVVMYRKRRDRGPAVAIEALLVAAVFDIARALALVIPGSHRARRS
jgi:GT2 family glycosyltransferase